MKAEKVSLSLEADVLAEARAESGGNLSAFVNEAVEARLRRGRLRQWLDENRPPDLTKEEQDAIGQELVDAFAAMDAAVKAREAAADGTEDLLARDPSVLEMSVVDGPLLEDVAYVVLANEEESVAGATTRLYGLLRRELGEEAPLPRLVIVPWPEPSGERPRTLLAEVVPLCGR